jgi:hypothetical protein
MSGRLYMRFLATVWDGGVQLVSGTFWFFVYVVKYNLLKVYDDRDDGADDQQNSDHQGPL